MNRAEKYKVARLVADGMSPKSAYETVKVLNIKGKRNWRNIISSGLRRQFRKAKRKFLSTLKSKQNEIKEEANVTK